MKFLLWKENMQDNRPPNSTAVMNRRVEPKDSLDYFPTPLWGTRALCEVVLNKEELSNLKVWEPACGEGHMSRALQEYFKKTISTDIFDYGYGNIHDFLETDENIDYGIDWIITNPPFNRAEEFVTKALKIAKVGVAVLCRVTWMESSKREPFFEENQVSIFAPFIGRLAMFKGRVDQKGASATAYAWFVWIKDSDKDTKLVRIPFNSRKRFEKQSDWS